MSPLFRRCCLLALSCALALPALGQADPVADLRAALKIDAGGARDPDLQLAAKRAKMIETALADLKSIAQLRQAYFLPQWAQHVRVEKAPKLLDLERFRVEIGDRLTKAIRAAAKEQSVEKQLAVAMWIAEIADSEQPELRDLKDLNDVPEYRDKFARGLTDAARSPIKEPDVAVRQAGLNALGKLTPAPGDAFPVLRETLQKDEVGPRRVAAYALVHLAKNARFHKKAERVETINQVVRTAAGSLRDADERVRGYCLQAVDEAAKATADFFSSAAESTVEVKGKRTLNADLQKILTTFQTANEPFTKALHDPMPNVRLASLQALDQIGILRAKIIQTLKDFEPEKRNNTAELLKAFAAPDPLGGIVEKLSEITGLLNENDVRMRRGAIDLLELLGDQAESAVKDIGQALSDPDRQVRWTAARAIRRIPPQKVGPEAIRTLGTMLIDPDPDLSRAAAEAIEALGEVAADAVDWLAFVAANGDTDSRNWDPETRVAAMRALNSIGAAHGKRAIPKVMTALADPDVRIRRQAADTLGRLGRPTDADVLAQELTALRRALSDEDADVRLYAAEAILSVAPTKKPL